MQPDGRKTLIKLQHSGVLNNKIGSTGASMPEQLSTLSHNTNRLASTDTEHCGWQRSGYMFALFPCLKYWGDKCFLCVIMCVMY